MTRHRRAPLVALSVRLLFFALITVTGPVTHAALITAHRGDSSHAPENTIAAINSAAGIADLTEMDVRVTLDGELVLMHDKKLNRTTNGSRRVSRRTLSELSNLDAGSWFSPAFTGEPVPTLAAAVDAALQGGLEPMIERKAGDAEQFHNEFVGLGLSPGDFRVISFNWNFLEDLHSLNPDYNLGALGWGSLSQGKINKVIGTGADFVSWHHKNVRSPTVVNRVHENGLELHVWTVNQPGRMQQLIDLGVDGITTDDPATLAQLLLPSMAPLTAVATVSEPRGWWLLSAGLVIALRLWRATRAG